MKTGLTIAIITKDRTQKLDRCIKSIVNQIQKPDEILIIDNDPQKSAYATFKKYSKVIPIKYLLEKNPGVPYARNKALKFAKTKLLGYIDDDCILDTNWVKVAMRTFKENPKTAYLCGKTNLFNTTNIWASAQHYHDWYWYIQKLRKNKKTTAENFDTKNIVLNRNVILKKGLRFDPSCNVNGFDSADFDFGLQMDSKNLNGIYVKNMQVNHEETSTFKRYVARGYNRGLMANYINKKWNFNNKFVDLPSSTNLVWFRRKLKRFPKDLKMYTKEISASFYFKILVTLAILIYEWAYLKGYQNFKNE